MIDHDKNVGQLLEVQAELGVADNTFVMCSTDNGPHITLIQRSARTADLENVYAAAGKVLAGANANTMKLEAIRYYYIPSGEHGTCWHCREADHRPAPGTAQHRASPRRVERQGTIRIGSSSAGAPSATARHGQHLCQLPDSPGLLSVDCPRPCG